MQHRVSDLLGSFLSMSATLFFVRAHILAWPISIVAICVDFWLYYQTGLYADMAKESIYFITMFYGWYAWLFGGEKHSQLAISRLSSQVWQQMILLGAVAIAVTVVILTNFTNSKVPVWDATTTVLALMGQWLTCRKILECWVIYFIADTLYAGLYAYKGLPWHTALSVLYLTFAIAGYWRWSKLRERELAWSA